MITWTDRITKVKSSGINSEDHQWARRLTRKLIKTFGPPRPTDSARAPDTEHEKEGLSDMIGDINMNKKNTVMPVTGKKKKKTSRYTWNKKTKLF